MTAPQDSHRLFTDLTEALAMACPMVCVAVIAKDSRYPGHIIGDTEAAQQLLSLDSVRATLADGTPRTQPPPSGTALTAAAFIAIEPLSVPHQENRATVIAFAGRHLVDCDRAVTLLHALATETANELMFLKQAPFLAAAFAEVECGVTIADPNLADAPLIYVNAAFERMTGYSKAELLGRNCRFLQGDFHDQPGLRVIRNAMARGTDCTAVVTNFRRSGEPFENRIKLRAIRTHDGSLSHIIGIQLDVTREVSALESLAREKRRYQSLIDTQPSYIWSMDAQGELIEVPAEWLALANLPASVGAPDRDAILAVLAPDAADAFRDGWRKALQSVTPFEVAYQLPARDRAARWFLDRVTPVLDDDNRLIEWIAASQEITALKRAERDRQTEGVRRDGSRFSLDVGLSSYGDADELRVIAAFSDTTELEQARREVEHAAYEDRLTGLLSPTGFAQRLDDRIEQDNLHPATPVLVIDIKSFSEINNTQGYDVGDELLREIARRLTAEVGAGGMIARTGGDEFTLLALGDDQRTPRQLRRCMAAVFDTPFEIRGFALHIEASFGYARIGSIAGDAHKLMSDAAFAMHTSRNNPRLSWTRYTRALERQTRQTVDMTTRLRHAIESNQLELHYQPQVNLASGRVLSAEALLRWNHPELGAIPPDVFIPLAEQSQLIGPIGNWVLRTACRDLRNWRDAGLPVTPVSINVSLIQFLLGSVPAQVNRALTEFAVAPKDLILEITESVFEQQSQALKKDLKQLSAMGVRLSLDDFGKGYSSLGHLNDYFFNEIKIDKSFVSQLDNGPYAQAIVRAVITIAAAIDADVVAEGVEVINNIAMLLQLGCTKGQGYHYSRPVAEVSFRELLSSGRRLP